MKSLARLTCTLVLTLAVTSVLNAAEPNFSGTWKLNLAKSKLGGTMYTIDKKPTGMWHYSGGGFEADFDLTGKENTMPSGVSVIGKELSPTSWELTFRMNGKTISTSRLTVTGDFMAMASDATGADGKIVQQSSTDTRVSGGPGFAGKWKSGEMKGASTTLQITMEGAKGITVSFPEFQSTCKESLDGKDYPVTGDSTSDARSYKQIDDNTLEFAGTKGGKVTVSGRIVVSADGKSRTVTNTITDAAGKKLKGTAVYDKQ
jgi:hypothetical protein